MWHTCNYGKQRQRQKRSQEGAQAKAKAGARAETRSLHAGPAQVGVLRPQCLHQAKAVLFLLRAWDIEVLDRSCWVWYGGFVRHNQPPAPVSS